MTQEEFNQMLAVAIAQNLGGGYYTSQYSGEEIDTLLGLTSYAAGSQVITDLTTEVHTAEQAAKDARDVAIVKAGEASTSASAAAASASSIQNMTVSATELPSGSNPTVTKTTAQGVINLDFGLPTAEVYSYTDSQGDGNIVIGRAE